MTHLNDYLIPCKNEDLAKAWIDGDDLGGGLPEVTTSDNGDVLTVVEGAWAKAAPTAGLPPVTSSDNGDVLTVVNGAWGKAKPPVILPILDGSDFSPTIEVEEGIEVDGTQLYYKMGSIVRLLGPSDGYTAFSNAEFPPSILRTGSEDDYTFYYLNEYMKISSVFTSGDLDNVPVGDYGVEGTNITRAWYTDPITAEEYVVVYIPDTATFKAGTGIV